MASVTGKTSIKIDDLINDTIIDGELVNGHLILRNRAGAEIDAGVLNVDSATILQSMPVGYVYISVDPTSPATLFGAGTWQRIAQGRMLVGQDPSQTEFDTVEETGGEKTHTLTTGELPAHTHAIDHDHPATTSEFIVLLLPPSIATLLYGLDTVPKLTLFLTTLLEPNISALVPVVT